MDALKKKFSRILNKKAKENGVIRIFLSSPFRGMEDERKQVQWYSTRGADAVGVARRTAHSNYP